MSLSDLASFGSFVSGVAVLASLVFLYFQIRQLSAQMQQNAKHTRAELFQASAARTTDLYLEMAGSDLSSAWAVGNGGTDAPDAVRKRQFECLCIALFVHWEGISAQNEEGLLADEEFRRIAAALAVQLRSWPGVRRSWGLMLDAVSSQDSKTRFIRSVLAEANAAPSG